MEPTLFDFETTACEHGEAKGPRYCAFCRRAGVQARETGESRALTAADDWRSQADRAIKYLAHLDDPFTSEDVIARAGLPTGNTRTNANNAVGAVMSAAARRGLIRKTGYTQSSRPSSHGAIIALWEGV